MWMAMCVWHLELPDELKGTADEQTHISSESSMSVGDIERKLQQLKATEMSVTCVYISRIIKRLDFYLCS